MTAHGQVSVVIPAYNAATTIEAAVESMLTQSLPPHEIIVVDDGSTDGTADVLTSFGDSIRIVRQDNRGLAEARTTGNAATTGDYVAWLDADDRALPERLEVQIAVMSAEPSVILVSSDFNAFGETVAPEERFARRYYGAISEERSLERIFGPPRNVELRGRPWRYYAGEARASIILGSFVHPPSVMIRRAGIERVGALNGDFPTNEDWLYFVELARHGAVAFIDEPLLEYRLSPDQMSQDGRTVSLNNLRSLEFVLAQEPEFAASHRRLVRQALGNRHADIAATLAEEEPLKALDHLTKAFGYGGLSLRRLKILAKIALPNAALRALRGER